MVGEKQEIHPLRLKPGSGAEVAGKKSLPENSID
jgi:hypothetical protein